MGATLENATAFPVLLKVSPILLQTENHALSIKLKI